MAYRRQGDESFRKRGKINPYLEEIRLQGHNISSNEFWKVVKRYERFSSRLQKEGLYPLNVWTATVNFFLHPNESYEPIRQRTLCTKDSRARSFFVLAYDLKEFRMKYKDAQINVPIGQRYKVLKAMEIIYNQPAVDNKIAKKLLEEVTLDDYFTMYANGVVSKDELYDAIERARKLGSTSPQYLAIGS